MKIKEARQQKHSNLIDCIISVILVNTNKPARAICLRYFNESQCLITKTKLLTTFNLSRSQEGF